MMYFYGFVALVGLRTLLWHVQSWQLREYRFDRLRSFLRTADGQRSLRSLWFFRGILPRPQWSVRALLVIVVAVLLSGLWFWLLSQVTSTVLSALLTERLLWLSVSLGVAATQLLVNHQKKRLFAQAKAIRLRALNLTVIALTGSYGKTSTKELLRHLLVSAKGADAVLCTPENQNNEIAIARLIRSHTAFFDRTDERFFIVEIGAYTRGEITLVCDFVQPHHSILTALGSQHLDLFGGPDNLKLGKWEIAQAAQTSITYPAHLTQLQPLTAQLPPDITVDTPDTGHVTVRQSDWSGTAFHWGGRDWQLPWVGEFFVGNALLALSVGRRVGLLDAQLAVGLASVFPLPRALHTVQHPDGWLILSDLYSANREGVLAAIGILAKGKGRKIFIGQPLLELGPASAPVHREIFTALHAADADVWWLKTEYQPMGYNLLSKKFHGHDLRELTQTLGTLKAGDIVLLESRLPQAVVDLVIPATSL